jgi:hypothetical protein
LVPLSSLISRTGTGGVGAGCVFIPQKSVNFLESLFHLFITVLGFGG